MVLSREKLRNFWCLDASDVSLFLLVSFALVEVQCGHVDGFGHTVVLVARYLAQMVRRARFTKEKGSKDRWFDLVR